ncbi:LacI family DNA-binding transcriptional regulator [Corynebacterium tapiri]|uniref:Substrate-binding domain-containing protein n=1 Tax=Corynebacterium tapiri TaxID=1448266 RepID=A0A5C4U299_9CORY|nr:LacI family DNA-binding transcriptional regulator [Corynebacterium tapiri]TNL96077.1 substrate-binding domain-containing protein [Corynebacterium tapiri]
MHKRRPRGTLASLAADLGVSRTTVSNAYNHPDQLSPALRARILAAAEARGYPGPDPTARSLRTRRVGSLGVLLTEDLSYAFEDYASVEFLAGLADSPFALTLVPTGSDGGNRGLVDSVVVDGFVVYSVASDDPGLAAVRTTGLPFVVCDQPYDVEGHSFVGIDDASSAALAARAVAQAGHRRIGILAKRLMRARFDGPVSPAELPTADLHVQRARVHGVLEELAAWGVDKRTIPIVTRHHNDEASAADGARELLERNPDLTAVVCTTDSMALGALAYAHDQRIEVPRELSITGFDGIELAKARGLTTIAQPLKAKGRMCGKLLSSAVTERLKDQAPADPKRVLLKAHLIPGATLAPLEP